MTPDQIMELVTVGAVLPCPVGTSCRPVAPVDTLRRQPVPSKDQAQGQTQPPSRCPHNVNNTQPQLRNPVHRDGCPADQGALLHADAEQRRTELHGQVHLEVHQAPRPDHTLAPGKDFSALAEPSLLAGRGEQDELDLPDFGISRPVLCLIHISLLLPRSGAEGKAPEHHHPTKTGRGWRIFVTPDYAPSGSGWVNMTE